MALGRQLAEEILGEEINKSDVKHVKGAYTTERNHTIVCRFYYHFTLKGLRYERCLTELNKEFHLSELRIAQLIMEGREALKSLKNEKADRKFLTAKYPYYTWS